MRSRLVVVVRIALVTALLPLVVSAQSQSQSVRQVPLTRSGPLPTTPPINANAEQGPEVDSALAGDSNDDGSDACGPRIFGKPTIPTQPVPRQLHHASDRTKR